MPKLQNEKEECSYFWCCRYGGGYTACVRVSAITDELSGEKIDVIEWSPDARRFIATALSPAKALSIELNEEEKKIFESKEYLKYMNIKKNY